MISSEIDVIYEPSHEKTKSCENKGADQLCSNLRMVFLHHGPYCIAVSLDSPEEAIFFKARFTSHDLSAEASVGIF